MSTVCDSGQFHKASTVRGLSCVQPHVRPVWPHAQVWGGADSPMRSERVSRVPSRWAADSAAQSRPPQSSLSSALMSMSSMSLAPGSVKCVRRTQQRSQYPARQLIPNAADVAPVGVAPVG